MFFELITASPDIDVIRENWSALVTCTNLNHELSSIYLAAIRKICLAICRVVEKDGRRKIGFDRLRAGWRNGDGIDADKEERPFSLESLHRQRG